MTQRASIPNDVPRAFEDEDCDRLPFVVSAPSQEYVWLLRYFNLMRSNRRPHYSRACTVLHDVAYGAYRVAEISLEGTIGWLNDKL